jgi:hypothetical protein
VSATGTALGTDRDIACILEAEEYALYFNGFQLTVTSGPQTCDYIDVKPFTFWRYMPGMSGRYDQVTRKVLPRKVVKYNCSDVVRKWNTGVNNLGVIGGFAHDPGVTIGQLCGQYVNVDDVAGVDRIQSTSIPPVKVENNQDLCSFTYENAITKQKYNCDEGEILITTVNFTATEVKDGSGNVIGAALNTPPTEFKCGGKAVACKAGPGIDY